MVDTARAARMMGRPGNRTRPAMAKIRIRHFVEIANGDGSLRRYWQPSAALRAAGWAPEVLDGGDRIAALRRAEELNALVDAWRRGEAPAPAAAPKAAGAVKRKGTVAELIGLYRKSPRYPKNLKTRAGYEWCLGILDQWAGDAPVAAITPKRVQKLYTALQPDTPAKANAVIRMLHILFEHARLEDLLKTNPAAKAKLVATAPRLRVWTLAEVDAVVAAADAVGRASVGDAVLLAYEIGQRQGDILRLPWLRYQDGRFWLRQRKRGALVDVPATPRLAARLEEARGRRQAAAGDVADSGAIVVSEETGLPYVGENFTRVFDRVRLAAATGVDLTAPQRRRLEQLAKPLLKAGQPYGAAVAQLLRTARLGTRLDGLTPCPALLGTPAAALEEAIAPAWFMDLRDTCVTRLASAGCTLAQICAVTGHTEASATRVLKHYLALNGEMARQAIAHLVAYEGRARPA